VETEATTRRGVERRGRRSQKRHVAASASPVDAETLQAELALAERMRDAVRHGRHARVLELAAQHRERFRGGELAVERDVHEIAALCRLGRHAQAGRRIAAFGGQHPRATVPAHVLAVCEKPTTSEASGQED
jgi:hypothetical protein